MSEKSKDQSDCEVSDFKRQPPGTLPASASELSTAARGLLLRLLDLEPRVRMRNFRQLQQSAFYMRYNFELVKNNKVSPKEILNRCFPDGAPDSRSDKYGIINSPKVFHTFDQSVM